MGETGLFLCSLETNQHTAQIGRILSRNLALQACALFRAMGFKNQKVVYELGSCASSVIHCTVVLLHQTLPSRNPFSARDLLPRELGVRNAGTASTNLLGCRCPMSNPLVSDQHITPTLRRRL